MDDKAILAGVRVASVNMVITPDLMQTSQNPFEQLALEARLGHQLVDSFKSALSDALALTPPEAIGSAQQTEYDGGATGVGLTITVAVPYSTVENRDDVERVDTAGADE